MANHKWTMDEKEFLLKCDGIEGLKKIAKTMKLPLSTVKSTRQRLTEEHPDNLAHFDYSKIIPLKALFIRCPVCGGTTTVNKTAYCRSCLSQWNPITLQPMEGLHAHDSW